MNVDTLVELTQLSDFNSSIILINAMDVRDIEYFAVIAEHGHLGRAAEALGLGQPALSISLHRLEKAADAKLVKRTPKGVELTAVGNALLSHVGRLRLARADLAREVADLAHGHAGTLRIGASPANAQALLPEVCAELLTASPKVTLDIGVHDNDALLPALRKGALDLIVAHKFQFPEKDIAEEVISEDEFVVYCAAKNPLAKRKSLSLAELANERWVATASSAYAPWRSLHQAFGALGLPLPHIALVSPSVALKLRVIASSALLGIGVKNNVLMASPSVRLTVLPVKGLDWFRPVIVAYRKDAYLPPVAWRIIELLKGAATRMAR